MEVQERLRLIGYMRCSTSTQAGEGHSLKAQETALREWARANEHDLVLVHADVMSGAKTASLHGRAAAIRLIESGFADGLLVLRFDRATRSTLDGAQLLEQSKAKGWPILTTTGGDSSDESRAFMTDVEIAFAAEERRRISQRTREGLRAAAAKGRKGGRRKQIGEDLEQRILDLRDTGRSARGIAERLNELGIAPPSGQTWHHSTITRTLRRLEQEEYT